MNDVRYEVLISALQAPVLYELRNPLCPHELIDGLKKRIPTETLSPFEMLSMPDIDLEGPIREAFWDLIDSGKVIVTNDLKLHAVSPTG